MAPALSTNVTRLVAIAKGDGWRARLARTSSASVILKALSAVLGFGIAVVLARSLGPHGYGIYAYVLAIVTIVALPAKAGLPPLVTRETAKALVAEHWRLLTGMWHWATRLVIAFSLIVGILGGSAGYFLSNNFTEEQFFTFLLGLALVPFLALGALRSASIRGLGMVIRGQLPEFAARPALLLLLLLVSVFALGDGFTPPVAMALNVFATILAFALGAYMLHRVRSPQWVTGEPIYRRRQWMIAALPMAATNAMHLVNTHVDVLLIGVFLESADVGYYRVAAQASLLIAFGLQASKMLVEPNFSRLYAQGDMVGLQKLATAVSQFNLAVAIIFIVGLITFGHSLISAAFGAAFLASLLPLTILACGRLAGATIGSSGHLLNMAGHERSCARYWLYAALLNVILNLILIPTFGTAGAAAATAFTLLLAHALTWRAAKRWVGCDCSPIPHFRQHFT